MSKKRKNLFGYLLLMAYDVMLLRCICRDQMIEDSYNNRPDVMKYLQEEVRMIRYADRFSVCSLRLYAS